MFNTNGAGKTMEETTAIWDRVVDSLNDKMQKREALSHKEIKLSSDPSGVCLDIYQDY